MDLYKYCCCRSPIFAILGWNEKYEPANSEFEAFPTFSYNIFPLSFVSLEMSFSFYFFRLRNLVLRKRISSVDDATFLEVFLLVSVFYDLLFRKSFAICEKLGYANHANAKRGTLSNYLRQFQPACNSFQ